MTRESQITRAQALVDRITTETEAETDRILAVAKADADAVLRATRKKARKRIGHEIERLRREQLDARRREEARLDTQRRLLKQREASAIIEAGLPILRNALTDLWADPQTRQAWCIALVARAAGQFGKGKWCVEHAGNWTNGDIAMLSVAIEQASGQRPDVREDPEIEAGLRLRAGSAVLDGSLAALMGSRKGTGAALLATIAENKGNGHE